MGLKQIDWVAAALALVLLAACGTADEDLADPLKPPSVYRNPQVYVTRAPTQTVDLTAVAQVNASATPEPAAFQVFTEPLVDDEQFLMDRIQSMLDEAERELNQIDINP